MTRYDCDMLRDQLMCVGRSPPGTRFGDLFRHDGK
jgi:hypothetical protein